MRAGWQLARITMKYFAFINCIFLLRVAFLPPVKPSAITEQKENSNCYIYIIKIKSINDIKVSKSLIQLASSRSPSKTPVQFYLLVLPSKN